MPTNLGSSSSASWYNLSKALHSVAMITPGIILSWRQSHISKVIYLWYQPTRGVFDKRRYECHLKALLPLSVEPVSRLLCLDFALQVPLKAHLPITPSAATYGQTYLEKTLLHVYRCMSKSGHRQRVYTKMFRSFKHVFRCTLIVKLTCSKA